MRFKVPSLESIQRIRADIADYDLSKKTGGIKKSGYTYRKENKLYNSFTTQDIVLYFRDKSIECGKRYFVSIEKDRGIIARLKKEYNFTNQELIDIIDFLFEECKYIQNPTINVLGSRWLNTLSVDAKNWRKGIYTSRKTSEELIENKNFKLTGEHKISISEW